MKRIITTLLVIIALALPTMARTYVLATGVGTYNNPNAADLPLSAQYAKEFSSLAKRKYPDTSLLTSTYANKENIMEKFNAILNRAGKDDQVIFYYSGHGTPGNLYTVNGELPYATLLDACYKSNAKEIIFLIEACFSGSAAEAVKAAKAKNQFKGNVAFLTSSRATESSWAGGKISAGFFSIGLMKGLRGKSDDNTDHNITLTELSKYIFNDVTARSKSVQHPVFIAPEAMKQSVIMKW